MPSPGLTKQRIVAAALAVLDEAGLDGLTVRAVASRLDVQAPALYWHVHNKQDLLDEMSTELWRTTMADVSRLSDGLSWQVGMRTFAQVTRRILLSHRDGAKVFSGTFLTDASILASREAPLQQMIDDGFTLADAVRASALVYNFTIGFCIEEQGVDQTDDDRYSLDSRAARFEGAGSPLMLEAGQHIFGHADDHFAALIELLVGTAERLRTK